MIEQLSYESYCHLRQGGEPASKVYQAWKEQELKWNSIDICHSLGEIVVGAVAVALVAGIFARLNYIAEHNVWITSPSDNTTRQLPLYQALRIIRKKQWYFTSVAPVVTKIPMSRKTH